VAGTRGSYHGDTATMAIRLTDWHRPPARQRRCTKLAVGNMEERLALSTTMPVSPPGDASAVVRDHPPVPIVRVRDVGPSLHPPGTGPGTGAVGFR
jgi:hypothetical protein